MLAMKIPGRIKELIKDICEKESYLRTAWNELYSYLDKIGFDSESNIVSNLQDGVGAEELIQKLEECKK